MLIDGRKISNALIQKLAAEVKNLPFQPLFCDVLVGDNPVSASYVRIKGRTAEKIGIKFKRAQIKKGIATEELAAEIKKLNQIPYIAGLIVQLPLPESLGKSAVLNAIDPAIDVDCLGKHNLEAFYAGRPAFVPPTAAAIIHILETLNLNLAQRKFLVIGQGELVGRPVTQLLRQAGYRMKTADKYTLNLAQLAAWADVIISAAGKAKLLTADLVNPSCVVIDAGTSDTNLGIAGDVDFVAVSQKAAFVTPVPGGVGPVTVAKLLENVVTSATRRVVA